MIDDTTLKKLFWRTFPSFLAAFLAAVLTYFIVEYQQPRPDIVHTYHVYKDWMYRRSGLLLDKLYMQSCYQIWIENDGDFVSENISVVARFSHQPLRTHVHGDVELRVNGTFVSISEVRRITDSEIRELWFRIPRLNPTEAVQIDLIFERKVEDEWIWPQINISFEHRASHVIMDDDIKWYAPIDPSS